MTRAQIISVAFQAINMNETGGRDELRYKFSDPDGERTGKSGYSYGASQFDIENNWDAIFNLKSMGFRPKDLDRLFEQRGDISDLNQKLKENAFVVDRCDQKHMEGTYEHCRALIQNYGIRLESDEVMIHIMDYHNQFHFSRQGKLHKALQAHGKGEVDSKFILAFKLKHTAWGQKRPDDVERRFRTIQKIYKYRVK